MAISNFTVGKPASGASETLSLPEGQTTSLSFGTDEIQGMKLSDSGELTISFTDGGSLTINNFRALANSEVQLTLEDGSAINSRELFEKLATDLPPQKIGVPQDGEALAYDIEPGRKYEFAFDGHKAVDVKEVEGALLITFDNNGQIVLQNFADAIESGLNADIVFEGEFMTLREFVDGLELAEAMQDKLEKDAEQKTADMQDARTTNEDDLAALAQKLAEVEPAAGDQGGPGGSSRGGYGFGSSYETTPINRIDDVGPIGPTALQYGVPEFQDDVFPDFTNRSSFVLKPPSVSANNSVDNALVKEDGSIFVPIKASMGPDTPASASLTVTVTGVPSSWGLAFTDGSFNAATGTWTITLPAGQVSYNGGLTFTPPAQSDVDLSGLTATASVHDPVSGQTATAHDNFGIIVDAVADDPGITASGSTGAEGTSLSVNLNGMLGVDTDGSEMISGYKISGVPTGFSFNNGTNLGGGVWSFTPAQITGLKITGPAAFDGTINLIATVLTTENPVTDGEYDSSDNNNQASTDFSVTWTPKIDTPTISVNGGVDNVQVKEDGSVNVTVTANLGPNAEPAEFLTVTITGFNPAWGTATAPIGSFNGAGTVWTVTLPAGTNLNTVFTFTPKAQSDIDLTGLSATATATDPVEGLSATSAPDTFNVIVDAVADQPSITASAATGAEGTPLAVTIAGALGVDADGSEMITGYSISGVPAGFAFNHGTNMGGGVWSFTPAQLAGLTITGPATFDGTLGLVAKVFTTENPVTDGEFDTADNDASATTQLAVTWTPRIDPPTILVNGGVDDAQVKEDGSVNVPLKVFLSATAEPAEFLTVTVTGFDPAWGAATASTGSFNAAGTVWTATLPAGTNLDMVFTFSPEAQSDIDLSGLQVTAKATDPVENISATATDSFNVIVDAVADAPSINASGATGVEGTTLSISIAGALGADTDGSEMITGYSISGVPAGFTLNHGSNAGGGVWNLTAAELAGLTITGPASFDGTLSLTAKVFTTENPVSDGEYDFSDNNASAAKGFTVTWTPTINPPTISVNNGVDNVQVKEDGSVSVAVVANLAPGAEPTEVLTVTITGFNPAWGAVTAPVGSFNAAGTVWTVTLPAGTNLNTALTFFPKAQSDIDLNGLQATAKATDPVEEISATSAPDTFNVIVDAVADAPSINASGSTGIEGVSLNVSIAGALGVDTDGSEMITGYEVSGVPLTGFAFNQGTNLGGGVWSFTQAQLAGLKITGPSTFNGTLNLTAKILTTENPVSDGEYDFTDNNASATKAFAVTWTPTINPPTISVNGGVDNAQVKEDGSVNVTVVANLAPGAEPTEVLSVTITGFNPAWGTVTAPIGSFNAAGTIWTATLPAGTNLNTVFTFTPKAQSDIDLSGLVATATATDPTEGISASSEPDSFNVIVDAVADKPSLDATGGVKDEGLPINITLNGALGADQDGSELISGYEISGVPAGFTFNHGTNVGGGVWSFTPAQIAGLQILSANPAFAGTLNLTAKVLTTENPVSDGEFDTTDNNNFATDALTVTWEDDDEPIVTQPETVTVDETNLSPTTSVTDRVEANFGDDTPGTFSINGGFFAGALTSHGVGVSVTSAGNVYTGKAGTATVFTLTLESNGDYTFKLFGTLDHPVDGPTAADHDDNIPLQFGFTARDNDGDTANGVITVNVRDDGPTANDDFNSLDLQSVQKDFNIVLVLDVSGSMLGTKLALLKSSVANLLSDFNAYNGGDIKVHIVPFSSTAATGQTYTVTDNAQYNNALTFLNNLVADGNTNYEAPLQSAISWLQGATANDPIAGADTYTYFISDGAPNRYVNGSDTSATGDAATVMAQITGSDGTNEVATIKSLSTKVIGVGIGVDATTLGRLDVIDSSGDALDVQDPNDLDAALQGTNPLIGTATGNVITGTGQTAGGPDVLSKDTNTLVTQIAFGATIVNVPSSGQATINGAFGVLKISADGSYTYTANHDGTDVFNYTITDGDGDTSTAKLTLESLPEDVTPSLTVNNGINDVKVKEDGSVFVPVTAEYDGGNGNETMTLTLTGVGAGWSFSGTGWAATATPGTYKLTLATGDRDYSGGFTLTPPAQSDVDLTGLNVTASVTGPNPGDSGTASDGFNVVVDAVADAPSVNVSNVTGVEGATLSVNVSGSLGVDTDGSELISGYEISGVTSGFTFNKGTNLGGGVWSFTPAQLSGLTITGPAAYNGTLNLTAKILTTENPVSDGEYDTADNNASATKAFTVKWTPHLDVPTISVNGGVDNVQVKEDGTVNVTVIANLAPGAEPTEVLTVTITGFNPAWGTVTSTIGSFNGAGTVWTATLPAGTNLNTVLTFKPKAQSDIDLNNLVATATANDPGEGLTVSSAPDTFHVVVDAVADLPSINASAGTQTGTSIAINVASALGVDTDGSELISGYEISGVPTGFTFNQGTNLNNGTWSFTPAQITGLTLNSNNSSFAGAVSLTAKVLTTENPVSDGEYDTADNNNSATKSFSATWQVGPLLIVGENVNDKGSSTTPYHVGTGKGDITGGPAGDILVGDVGGSTLSEVQRDFNIVMVLDTSGSMGSKTDPNSKMSLLIDAVEELLKDFNDYDHGTIQVRLVPFATNAYTGGTYNVTTASGLAAAINFLNAMPQDGWTNYEAALNSAITWLNGSQPIANAETLTYFISDGEPNYYLNNSGGLVENTNANVAMDQIRGADGSNEIASIKALSDEVIGVGIDIGTGIWNIAEIDSDGTALNIDDKNDIAVSMQRLNPLVNLKAVGDDVINGNDTQDFIFGDSLNTDALALAKGLAYPAGAGWAVFEHLEGTSGWNRASTIAYIKANWAALSEESHTAYGDGRTGGSDTITGGGGDDYIFGQEGNDTLNGNAGWDLLDGGSGNDTIYGEDGNDLIYGREGNDTIRGGVGNDDIYGDDDVEDYNGNDAIYGEDGDDYIAAAGGNDFVDGGNGNDIIYGWTGDDDLRGGAGNDDLVGENGNDVLYGNAGADTFWYTWTHAGVDTIKDFKLSENDVLDLSGLLSSTSVTQNTIDKFIYKSVSAGVMTLSYDLSGSGNAANGKAFAKLEGVTSLDLKDMVGDGNLII